MVTRINPLTLPAESGEMQLAPLEFTAAPPPGLRKRLVTAVQQAYPGWTVTVTVVTWTPDEVQLRLHATRDPASGAPPAPLPGSEAADKLVRRTGNVLEKILEKLYPGSQWRSVGIYSSPNRHTLDVEQSAARTRPTDPPTCADGILLFPDLRLAGGASLQLAAPGTPTPPWLYFHCHMTPSQVPGHSALVSALNGAGSNVLNLASCSWWNTSSNAFANPAPQPPVLRLNGSPVLLTPQRTFAYPLSVGTLLLQSSNLSDWFVWRWR